MTNISTSNDTNIADKRLADKIALTAHKEIMKFGNSEPLDSDEVDNFTEVFKTSLNKLNGNA